MRASVVAAAAGLLLAGSAGAEISAVGHWEGQLVEKGQALDISYDLSRDASGVQGRFSAPRWAVMDYPLDHVALTGDRVAFHMGGDALEGRLSGGTISGTFKGSDGEGTFTLMRAAAPIRPYSEVPVTFRNGGVVLSGTLLAPRASGRHPGVVLVHGSGPEVRWGTNRYIADRFARAGVAALVYDKRGSGQSGGDWRKSTYQDLARDALAGVALLAARPDVDAARIGILGHSEGGMVAPIAESLAPDKVAFLVAEDTPAGRLRDGDLFRVTNDINAQDWSPDDKQKALAVYRVFLEAASGDRPYADFAAASGPVRNQPWFQYMGLPPQDNWIWAWYRDRANVDSRTFWRTVRQPVLLVYGEHDQLMPVDQTIRGLEAALDQSGAPYAAIIAPRAEHNLTIVPRPGEAFFWWRQAPGVIDTVVAWVTRCTAPGGVCRV